MSGHTDPDCAKSYVSAVLRRPFLHPFLPAPRPARVDKAYLVSTHRATIRPHGYNTSTACPCALRLLIRRQASAYLMWRKTKIETV